MLTFLGDFGSEVFWTYLVMAFIDLNTFIKVLMTLTLFLGHGDMGKINVVFLSDQV